jgi:hypothetical protein
LLISDPIDYKSLNISIIIVNEWKKETNIEYERVYSH